MMKILSVYLFYVIFVSCTPEITHLNSNDLENVSLEQADETTPCTCGIFLSSQFQKASQDPPEGSPALLQEINKVFACNQVGIRQCQSKCLEAIVPYLPTSHKILCASLDRDIHKERAYLFLQNCNSTWVNTNMAAGKEYCCKDGQSVKCPK